MRGSYEKRQRYQLIEEKKTEGMATKKLKKEVKRIDSL